jgi:short-subunit dehydrogenase
VTRTGPPVVVITGASSGIGEAIARHAARDGASVVVAARRLDRLQALVTSFETSDGRGLAVECDVTRAADVDALVERAIATFGRIDVMVANAGIGYHGPFETTPEAVMARLVDVNLMGTLHAARAALVVMKRQGQGHIIAVSSIVGRRGIGGSAVYSATKAAQVAFIEALRAECHGTNIHASVVLPVSTVTEFHDAIARDFGHRVSGRGPRQSADVVAAAVMRCIRSPRPEVYPYALSRLLSVANVLAPALTDRVVQRFRRRQLPPAESRDRHT